MKDENKQNVANFIIQQINNTLVPVDEVKKPGLVKIPKAFKLPLIGEIDLGVGYKPKESRIVIINEGNQLYDFFLNMTGYCFLHELLPEKIKWEHEKHRWWVVQIPQSEDKLVSMLNFLKRFLTVSTKCSDAYFNFVVGSSLSDELKEICLYYPLFTVDDMNYLLESIRTGREPKKYTVNDPLEQDLFDQTGMLWLEGLTIERSIGYREISFSEYDDTDSVDSIKHHNKVMSAVFVASFFPYAFKIPAAEDANLIETEIILGMPGQCINPFIAHVMFGNAFRTFKMKVVAAVTKVVRQNPIHEESIKIAMDAGRPANLDVIGFLEKEVLKEMQSVDNFFGFDFSLPQVLEVEMVGTLGQQLKSKSVETYSKARERINALLDAKNKVDVEKNLAIAANQELMIEAEEIKKSADALGLSVTDYIRTIWTEKQKVKQLAANKPGGVVVSPNLANTLISNS